MNHIHRLMTERDEARAKVAAMEARIHELEAYYLSSKFHGENDYAYVRTDVLPRLRTILDAESETAEEPAPALRRVA